MYNPYSIETFEYRVLFQTEGGYKVFKFVTEFTKDEVIDRFAELANTHSLRGLVDVFAMYPHAVHWVNLCRNADEIAFTILQNNRESVISQDKPIFWEIDKQYRDYGLLTEKKPVDFLWDNSMMYARVNDTSDWIKVTDYPTEHATNQYKTDQFEGFLKECLHGKWFRKGSDYFQVLRELLEYSNNSLEAVGFESTDALLLDELDAMLQQEALHVEYDLITRPDPWDDYGDDYVHQLRIVQLPEWLRNDAIDKFVDDLFTKIVK